MQIHEISGLFQYQPFYLAQSVRFVTELAIDHTYDSGLGYGHSGEMYCESGGCVWLL